jgi:hypothetical protein
MDKLLNNKLSSSTVGLLQALAVVGYISLVSLLLMSTNHFISKPPEFVAAIVMLTTFVLSAGITGTLVFGLPAYFALRSDIKRAISILAFTFLSLFVILLVAALIIFTVY